MAEAEHRGNPRQPYDEPVVFRKPRAFTARGVDLGAGGIGVDSPVALEVGAGVEFEIFEGHAITFGTVRWCTPGGSGYRVGIQFREEDWNVIELVQTLRSQEG